MPKPTDRWKLVGAGDADVHVLMKLGIKALGIVSASGLLRVAANTYHQITPNFENARLQTELSAEDESDTERLGTQRVERETAGSVGKKIGNGSGGGHGMP